MSLEDRGGTGAAVNEEVVEDGGGARRKDGGELGLDPDIERLPVHRAGDHPESDRPLDREPGDEGLGVPAAEWGAADQAFALRGAPAQAGEALALAFCDVFDSIWFPSSCGILVGTSLVVTAPRYPGSESFQQML